MRGGMLCVVNEWGVNAGEKGGESRGEWCWKGGESGVGRDGEREKTRKGGRREHTFCGVVKGEGEGREWKSMSDVRCMC